MLAHHLIPIVFKGVISPSILVLLDQLALWVLDYVPTVLFLLNGFDLLLEVPGLIVNGTRHNELLLDQVTLGLLHPPHKLTISPGGIYVSIILRIIPLPLIIRLQQMWLGSVIVVLHDHALQPVSSLLLLSLVLVMVCLLAIYVLPIELSGALNLDSPWLHAQLSWGLVDSVVLA